jgi:hypothetical protein
VQPIARKSPNSKKTPHVLNRFEDKMSSVDPYAEYYATPEEWQALWEDEERERAEFYSLPPHLAMAILRAAFPTDGVIVSLDAGPESF